MSLEEVIVIILIFLVLGGFNILCWYYTKNDRWLTLWK